MNRLHTLPAPNFADMAWLFTNDNRNRGLIRQNFDEAALLWRCTQATGGPILEIGRFHGGTTVLLAVASAGRRLVSIDIAPQHAPECDAFLTEVATAFPDRLDIRIGDSRTPLENHAFGMLFIDGDHSYDGVRADTIAHWRSLRPFDGKPALVVYHDAVPNEGLAHRQLPNHCEGVRLLCQELVDQGCARIIGQAGSSLALEKLTELPTDWSAGIVHPPVADPVSGALAQRSDIVLLARRGGVGIELGVAEGSFSEALLEKGVLSHLYSIDMYAGDRGHDLDQYKRAILRLGRFKEKNSLLKMRFDEALDLFEDEFFDFIYIDGYAHTGQEDGKTIRDWYSKLKPGGIFAGDDYDPKWPLVMTAVDAFAAEKGLKISILSSQDHKPYSYFPSWCLVKPR